MLNFKPNQKIAEIVFADGGVIRAPEFDGAYESTRGYWVETIEVCVENGQFWAMVIYEDGLIRKVNLAQVSSVLLSELILPPKQSSV